MARTKAEVNAAEFQKVVNDLESTQQFPNLSALWKAVADTDWAKSLKPKPLTASVAYLRAREFKTVHQTKA